MSGRPNCSTASKTYRCRHCQYVGENSLLSKERAGEHFKRRVVLIAPLTVFSASGRNGIKVDHTAMSSQGFRKTILH